MLQRAKITTEDKLIFLGDYVDGWSEAVETVDFLISLKATYSCIFLRGNHDELCLNWLKNGEENATWVQHGGKATIASYKKADKETVNAHRSFYENLINFYIDEKNRLFLHAGFTNLKGVDYEYISKTFYWDRTLWELANALDQSLLKKDVRFPSRLKQYDQIFIGHTPISKTEFVIPKNAANVWNVDTGAAFKGAVTILDVNTKEFWQSEPTFTFYPAERGRKLKIA